MMHPRFTASPWKSEGTFAWVLLREKPGIWQRWTQALRQFCYLFFFMGVAWLICCAVAWGIWWLVEKL